MDAQYEKVRQGGQVLDAAVLIACGVDAAGNRDVLGCSVSLSEAEVHWRVFISELKDRGLHGLELIVSDAHEGLKAARKAVFPSVPWQRCQCHLQQNAGQYVPKMAMRAPVAADIRAIFTAPDQDAAEHLLQKFLIRYQKTAPKLVAWAEEAIPEGFTVFSLPASHRRRPRTTNLVERLNQEIRRRTCVARLFPNEAACLRLVSAVLIEISEDWQTADKRYVVFDDVRDRDAIYGKTFRRQVTAPRIQEVPIAPRSPWQHAYAERVIGTIRRECLNHMIVLGERHLRRILRSYVDYYNSTRTHLSLDKDTPEGCPIQHPNQGKIIELKHVGGLHHEYVRRAA